jgi:hypothetical protein
MPTRRELHRYIAFEEQHLLNRAANTHPDERLTYEQSYMHFPAEAEYKVYFDRFYPGPVTCMTDDEVTYLHNVTQPFPIRTLIASLNIVVAQLPRFLSIIFNLEAQVSRTSI